MNFVRSFVPKTKKMQLAFYLLAFGAIIALYALVMDIVFYSTYRDEDGDLARVDIAAIVWASIVPILLISGAIYFIRRNVINWVAWLSLLATLSVLIHQEMYEFRLPFFSTLQYISEFPLFPYLMPVLLQGLSAYGLIVASILWFIEAKRQGQFFAVKVGGKPITRAGRFVRVGTPIVAAGLFFLIVSAISGLNYRGDLFVPLFMIWAGLLTLILSLCALIADLAASKGRSWAAFFWLAALVSPLIMWIIAATISPLPGSANYVGQSSVAPSQPLTPQSPGDDIAAQIQKIGALRDQGLITDDEFESKKAELLKRL